MSWWWIIPMYAVVSLVIARVAYTKHHRGELFANQRPGDAVFSLWCLALYWPVVAVGWCVFRFVTAGARKDR